MEEFLTLLIESGISLFIELLCNLSLLSSPRTLNVPSFIKAILYGFLGICTGGLSLTLFAKPVFNTFGMQVANLLIGPLGIGMIMDHIGIYKIRKGKKSSGLENFWFSYCFSFCLLATRFLQFNS